MTDESQSVVTDELESAVTDKSQSAVADESQFAVTDESELMMRQSNIIPPADDKPNELFTANNTRLPAVLLYIIFAKTSNVYFPSQPLEFAKKHVPVTTYFNVTP